MLLSTVCILNFHVSGTKFERLRQKVFLLICSHPAYTYYSKTLSLIDSIYILVVPNPYNTETLTIQW